MPSARVSWTTSDRTPLGEQMTLDGLHRDGHITVAVYAVDIACGDRITGDHRRVVRVTVRPGTVAATLDDGTRMEYAPDATVLATIPDER